MYKNFALFYKKYFIILQYRFLQKTFKRKNCIIKKWAIVLNRFWEKYLVKIIQNLLFKRYLTGY